MAPTLTPPPDLDDEASSRRVACVGIGVIIGILLERLARHDDRSSSHDGCVSEWRVENIEREAEQLRIRLDAHDRYAHRQEA